jgi:hypothetical protein
MQLFVLAIFCSIAALTSADYWGDFKADDCIGNGLRQYSSVLHGIPFGQSWESHCADGPKAIIVGQTFDRPFRCTNEGPGIRMWGEFAVTDASCVYNIGSALRQGYQLGIGAELKSPLGRFRLIMQSDGNLVLYRVSDYRAIWSSNTANTGAYRAIMQYDGNFVVYTGTNVAVAKWATHTVGQPANYLLVQDDGNLVIYSVGSNTVQWTSNTAGFKTKATNLRTESSDSASVENIGAMTMQEALPNATVGIVHFDRDPNTAGGVAVAAPDQASNLTLGGTN